MSNISKIKYTMSAMTTDEDAISINQKLNDVTRMIAIGNKLKFILESKFSNSNTNFNRWVKMNVDKDIKSIIRYMTLADNEALLAEKGVIRLSEAYSMLCIDGNISTYYNTIDDYTEI